MQLRLAHMTENTDRALGSMLRHFLVSWESVCAYFSACLPSKKKWPHVHCPMRRQSSVQDFFGLFQVMFLALDQSPGLNQAAWLICGYCQP